MLQKTVGVIQQAEARGKRAVILVPEGQYPEALLALACTYTKKNAGRTAQMDNGNLLTLMSTQTNITEVSGDFDLYLCGWGYAVAAEERSVQSWISMAKAVFTEIS